tara:strand:+ start:311 stop:856 length:546 start_codon:yes stop_codon:yes gene_type:complete
MRILKFLANRVGRFGGVRQHQEVVTANSWNINRSNHAKNMNQIQLYQQHRRALYYFMDKLCTQVGKPLPINYYQNTIVDGSRAESLTRFHMPGACEEVRSFTSEVLRMSPDRLQFLMDRNQAQGKRWNTGLPLSVTVPRLAKVVSYLDSQLAGYEITMDLFVYCSDIPEPSKETGQYALAV